MAKKTLAEQLALANSRLSMYQKAINMIDDYFEYRMESVVDQKEVHKILGNLTDSLSKTRRLSDET